ncbi:HNH endonuclease signature motif containing protein [Pedococcus sp. 5OH_020]|uniref:HNH endonuclease signature motif containing protein n=1 Tax=Pedococcus sp. 5OH_020 TaxID=2989814 RepID=UPI0022E9F857|nr:HNH endonuclease signature motif containing protein [Pedococcus sp. 5OH_020]
MSLATAAVAHEATTQELWERASRVAGVLNRAHSDLVDVAVQLIEGGHWGDGGFRSVEHWLVVRAGLSPSRASDVVGIARRRGELPDAATALAAGELSVDQAAVLARHARADHQAGLARFARHTTVPQLRRALSRSVFLEPGTPPNATPSDGATDPLTALREAEDRRRAERAGAKPDLAMHYDEVGRFHLRYSAPADVGALVEQAVKEARDALFPAVHADSAGAEGGHAGAAPSFADGLAEVAARSLASVQSAGRAARYRVYVHLSTDGAWVGGGGAITPALAGRFTCDGTAQPLWEAGGRPVSVGRGQRIVPLRTRRLIEDRDRGCRFPGCGATRFVEVHHLDHWADGGATDYDRQLSLCPFHHDAHHRGDYSVSGDPVDPAGLIFTNRYGVPVCQPVGADLRGPSQAETRASNEAAPYPSPAGGPMRARDVEFVQDGYGGTEIAAGSADGVPLRLVSARERRLRAPSLRAASP